MVYHKATLRCLLNEWRDWDVFGYLCRGWYRCCHWVGSCFLSYEQITIIWRGISGYMFPSYLSSSICKRYCGFLECWIFVRHKADSMFWSEGTRSLIDHLVSAMCCVTLLMCVCVRERESVCVATYYVWPLSVCHVLLCASSPEIRDLLACPSTEFSDPLYLSSLIHISPIHAPSLLHVQ